MRDQKRSKLLQLLLLGFGVVAAMILAGGLSTLELQPGNPSSLLGLLGNTLGDLRVAPYPPPSIGVFPMDLLFPIFWACLALSLIYAIISPEYRKLILRVYITSLIFGLLLILVTEHPAQELESLPEEADEMAENSMQELDKVAEEADESESGPDGVIIPSPPSFITNPPGWFFRVISLLLGLLFLGATWLLWRVLRPIPDTQSQVVGVAERALLDLRAGQDLTDVVMRCYAKMSQILRKSRNIERHRAMTPREFEDYLAGIGMRDKHIQRLTRLFESVRYGARPSDGPAEREAITCLQAIVQAYGKDL